MADTEQGTAWQQACEQVAQDHIRSYRAWEHREISRRLADAIPRHASRPELAAPGLIWQQVADLVRVAEQYLEQEYFSDTTKAEQVATAMMGLRDAMLDPQECQDIEELGASLETNVERLAAKHGPQIRSDVIRQRAVQLLRTEDEAMHLLLASLATAVRRWTPFDDHDTSDRQGVLADHHQAEVELAGVLVQLIHLVCQPDQDPSPQAQREALAEQLAKYLEPMGPLVAKAPQAEVGWYVQDLTHALGVWMRGKPAGAQMLANAVLALPDVLEEQGGAT